ncbi:anillin isoform X2 [Microplitis demolitor]|uniref:anillin isoform X2 n=1 Tax=Microplitis demolitor TaxID=69319 RepID=UPI0004CCCA46|nr:anillin isoform X2 [Microplitis demolitor]
MDPFTQRMLERAKARREKLDTQLSNAGHEIKRRSPLKEATINIPSPVKTPPKSIVQENKENTTTLAANVKSKLDRLGKLYSDEDRELLSSPIHRTEEKFSAEETSDVSASKKCGVGGARLDRLAALASTINNWEDDLSHPTVAPKEPIRKTNTRFNYKPSPTKAQERSVRASSVGRDVPEKKKLVSEKTKTPEKVVPSTSKTPEKSIASTSKDRQGSSRTPEKSTKEVASGNRTPSSLATKAKDPAEMSLSERMAMFERNKGEALIPKAPLSLPVSTKKLMECQKVCNQTSPDQRNKAVNKSGTQNKRALFEGLPKQQLENDILRDTQAERKKELEMLRSRFNKNKESAQAAAGSCIRPRNNSDGSPKNSPVCPVKPTPATEQAPPPPPPPLPSAQESRTPTKRQVTTLKAPAVQTTRTIFSDVKRIKVSPPKPGHLYPDLTAIESSETETTDSEYTVGTTEAETATLDEPTDTETDLDDYYGLEQEVSTNCDDSNTSFENSIMRIVKESKKSNSCNKRQIESDESSSSDISVLDEMDEYLDECLALQEAQNHGPTPPKQNRAGNSPSMASTSFKYSQNIYKSPIKITPSRSPRKKDQCIIDGDSQVPLMHSVSFYRRQQSQTPKTPIRQVKRSVESTDCEEPTDEGESAMVQVKIKQLMEEVCKQQTIIGQASQALNLCTATVEFSGSREQVEGERLLLVATHRRHAALNEIQRMRVEGTLRPVLPGSSPRQERGSLTISALTLPLKRDHSFNINSDMCLHFLCLIRHLDTVIATPVVQVDRNDSCIRFPSTIKLDDLYSDFKITIEVYSLETRAEILPHEIKYHIYDTTSTSSCSKKNGKTPKKYLKNESRLIKPSQPSPGGPGAVRSPSFSLTGYVVFSLKEINRNQFTLNKVPRNSSLEGHLLMHVSCELNISIEHRGFLTMFQDIGGCGSWRRRWCLLKGDTLSSWTYPEDENKKTPVDSLGLREVITNNISLVSRDICARPNTFLLETMRRAQPNDKDSLVMVKNGPNTTIRHLLSADTKEERLQWVAKLNASLHLLRAWGGISATN